MEASELLDEARARLRAGAERFDHPGDAVLDAAELLEAALGHAPENDEEISPAVARRFERMLARREQGEPMPYILGYIEFANLRLRVKRGAFIPRHTTEFLAKEAIRRLRARRRGVAVDVATGVGPIALAIAHGVPGAAVHGTDLTDDAVRQARANARSLGIRNVRFHRGDLFAALPSSLRGGVDVVTSHPPYVGRGEVRTLPAEIRDFEPITSLTDRSSNGLGLAHAIVRQADGWLRPGGWLLIEIGSYLARDLRSAIVRAGYRDVQSRAGEWRYTRVVSGRLPR